MATIQIVKNTKTGEFEVGLASQALRRAMRAGGAPLSDIHAKAANDVCDYVTLQAREFGLTEPLSFQIAS
ncbi:MAG: hypothetical protein CMH25_02850 [Micavibrio sp.]|nr:hypothetical protein [Micavibrio sp.]|tara:strand:+ start:712 stop:921 length:210 start_codon:yes stop_codon:yes gene_type:complete